MKKYESVFILDIRKVEDDGSSFTEELKKLIETGGGELVEAVPMGRKQFAYGIKGKKAGMYWNYIFQTDPAKVADLRKKYRLDERVLRMLFINYDRPE